MLRTFAAVPPSARVLDVSQDEGRHLVALALLDFDVHGVRVDGGAVERLQAELGLAGREDRAAGVRAADPARLPYDDGWFDWVVACGTLDGYSDAERIVVVDELRRVLAPGGWLYVSWRGAADRLSSLFVQADFAVAEKVAPDEQLGGVRGIFRRVEADTVG